MRIRAALALATFLAGGCATPEEKAKKELEERDKELTAEGFVSAAAYGGIEVVELYLAAGMDPDVTDRDGRTPLISAAGSTDDRSQEMKILLETGADVDHMDGNMQTALYAAADRGNEEAVLVLLDEELDLDRRNRNGISPLSAAVRRGHVDIVKILIEADADLESRAMNGMTPLMMAAFKGCEECAKLLIEAGANIFAEAPKCEQGKNAWAIATNEGHDEIAKMLVAEGFDPERDN